MNWLIRYLKGYVHIRLISREPERFLNLCAHNRILLWRLVSRDGFYEMYLSAADFFRLHSLCRKSGSRIKVIGKYGLPFFLYRNRKRKAFFLGILLCMCLLYVLSLFIWNIHVSGNYANSTGTILAFLEQEGITHGILKAKLNCSEIAALLREEFSNITWVSAKIEGTQLILEVKENVDGYVAEEETPTEPSNLVASKDGIVASIITRSGTPLVLPGASCKEGDVLVSGEIAVNNDNLEVVGYRYVPADADILIETVWYYYDEFPLVYEERSYQEEGFPFPFLQIGDFRLESFLPWKETETSDVETYLWKIHLTENFVLPVSVGYQRNLPYTIEKKEYSREEAQELARRHFEQYKEKLEKEQIQVKESSVTTEITDTACRTRGTVTVLEQAVERQNCEQRTVEPTIVPEQAD